MRKTDRPGVHRAESGPGREEENAPWSAGNEPVPLRPPAPSPNEREGTPRAHDVAGEGDVLSCPSHGNLGRRRFCAGAMMSAVAFLAGTGKVFGDMPEDCEITRVNVTVPRLPKSLDGLRAALVSDIHSGPFMSGEDIAAYVGLVNDLDPDVIFLPGDFITSSMSEIPPVCEALRGLRAKHGVFGCLGNHDFIVDANTVSRRLIAAGVHILRNRHVMLRIDGACLAVVGVDDVTASRPFDASFPAAVSGLDPSIPSIALCHKPYPLDDAASWGVSLMLSGHTHGGQIVLGRLFGAVFAPAAVVTPYIAGLYRLDTTRLYVTRGIGTVFVPRFNCPPEITLLTLRHDGRS